MKGKPVDELARRLKEEGLAESPAFSTELHARVMEGLRAKGLELPDQGDNRAPGGPWRIFVKRVVPLAIAAGIGIVAFIALWPHTVNLPPTQQEKIVRYEPLVPDDLVKPLQDQVATPTAEAWERGKYGYLDQDARRLAIFVASQLPGVPVTDGKDGN